MSSRRLTSKGKRQADGIVEAAIDCLGRDGYAGTSLQRVADQAGVRKRMVLYYFGSREELIAETVERLGERFFSEVEERLRDVEDPGELTDRVFDVVREQLSDRGLVAAYFGLVAESVADPTIRASLLRLRERGRALADRALDDLEASGRRLAADRDVLTLSAAAAAHGLGIELLQRGETPELERALGAARLAVTFVLFGALAEQ